MEAEKALRRSLSADPNFSPALAEMATIAEERGAAATAIEHLRRRSKITPGRVRARQ